VPSTLTADATCTMSNSLRHGCGKLMFLPIRRSFLRVSPP
jgi:hypothetical protein